MRQPLDQGKQIFDVEMGWPKGIADLAVLALSFKLTPVIIAVAGPGSLFGQIFTFEQTQASLNEIPASIWAWVRVVNWVQKELIVECCGLTRILSLATRSREPTSSRRTQF